MDSAVCQDHNNPFSQISFSANKAQLICEECIIDRSYATNKSDDIIIQIKKVNTPHYNQALSSPVYLLSKTTLQQDFPGIFEQLIKFDENELTKQSGLIEKKIQRLQSLLDTIIKGVKNYVQFIISLRKQLQSELRQVIRLNEFEQLINELNSNNVNPDIIQQIEDNCFKYYQSISPQKNNNQYLIKQIKQSLKASSLKLKQYQKIHSPETEKKLFNFLVNDFNASYTYFFSSTFPKYSNYTDLQETSNLLTISFASKLNNLIEEKSKKIIKSSIVIYLGSRDGINGNAFWSKVNGKRNLLMVFKSKNNNYVFGGYSPCQWQQNLSAYVQDDTLSSFLFSQTRNEIYPLKQDRKQYAIYCNQNQGPSFGSGHDMYIAVDFTTENSNLGHSYQWDQYKNAQSNQLFGGAQSNVSECEIYELTFA